MLCLKTDVRLLPYYTLVMLEVNAWKREWNVRTLGTAVLLRIGVLWRVTPCRLVTGSRRFEGSRRLPLREE